MAEAVVVVTHPVEAVVENHRASPVALDLGRIKVSPAATVVLVPGGRAAVAAEDARAKLIGLC